MTYVPMCLLVCPSTEGMKIRFQIALGIFELQVMDETVPVLDLPSKVRGVLWDTWPGEHAHIFVVYDNDFAYSYVFLKDSVAGKSTFKPSALSP